MGSKGNDLSQGFIRSGALPILQELPIAPRFISALHPSASARTGRLGTRLAGVGHYCLEAILGRSAKIFSTPSSLSSPFLKAWLACTFRFLYAITVTFASLDTL